MGRRIEIIGMVVVLLLSAVAISIAMEEGADAVGEPDITIALAQAKQTADVAPGQDGIVTFTGTVFVEMPYAPNVQYLVVQLQADAGDWPVSVPPALTFSKAQKQQSFTMSVQVPIGTSSGGSYDLIVGGTWSYSPGVQSGECAPTSSLIFVKQYFSHDLNSDDLFKEALRGKVAQVEIGIENTGNGEDEILIEVVNSMDLLEEGIEPYFNDDTHIIPENESRTAILFLRVSESTHRGTREIDVQTYSKMGERLGEEYPIEDLTIFIDIVDQLSDPEPEPDPEPDPEPEDPVKEDPVVEDPVIEDPEVENDLGNNDDQVSDGSSSIVIPIVVVIVVVLLVGICLGIYFFIRSTGKKRND